MAPVPAPNHPQTQAHCTISQLGCPGCSHWEFYAICKGLKGPQLHTTWDTTHLKVINPAINSPFQWSKF
eukprot:6371407-Ditylum_brightwellii.AAC.1